jgi:hypothetical protein
MGIVVVSEQLDKIKKIANNALYFDDSSDYQTALWEILTVTSPELFEETEEPDLEYIEDE